MVTLKLPYRLAAAAGLCLASLGYAQQPQTKTSAPQMAVSGDQKIADAVASRIAGMPSLSGLTIQVACDKGVVEVSGVVGDSAQHSAVVHAARSTKGVVQVRDAIKVSGVQQVKGPPEQLSAPAPVMTGGGGPGLGLGVDPMPVNGGPGGYALAPPTMPPYAWPTYAPYNNYSRVAYPNEYPQSAFPYIGPMYPFPKVPLGYRAIKLEWEDGHWWYGRTAVNRDWWMVRYW